MAMSRKDYRIIAEALNNAARQYSGIYHDRAVVETAARYVANALLENSPLNRNGNRLFNRDTFLDAAGVIR